MWASPDSSLGLGWTRGTYAPGERRGNVCGIEKLAGASFWKYCLSCLQTQLPERKTNIEQFLLLTFHLNFHNYRVRKSTVCPYPIHHILIHLETF